MSFSSSISLLKSRTSFFTLGKVSKVLGRIDVIRGFCSCVLVGRDSYVLGGVILLTWYQMWLWFSQLEIFLFREEWLFCWMWVVCWADFFSSTFSLFSPIAGSLLLLCPYIVMYVLDISYFMRLRNYAYLS